MTEAVGAFSRVLREHVSKAQTARTHPAKLVLLADQNMRGEQGFLEFNDALEGIGADSTTWYEAVGYLGEPKRLTFELYVGRGLRSKVRVAGRAGLR